MICDDTTPYHLLNYKIFYMHSNFFKAISIMEKIKRTYFEWQLILNLPKLVFENLNSRKVGKTIPNGLVVEFFMMRVTVFQHIPHFDAQSVK